MKATLSYLYQLPQNLLGLLFRAIHKGHDSTYKDAIVRRSTSMQGGISLGRYIIINQWCSKTTVMHEWGHCRQSKKLGWLYLIVIGLPSLLWATFYTGKNYYKFYTEKWADKLGGVQR